MSITEEWARAVRKGDLPRVQASLALGQSPDVELLIPKCPHIRGLSALMFACWKGWPDLVQLLLGYGASVNAQSNAGYSPLMFAADRSCFAIIRVLLDCGADAGVRGKDGRTALSLLLERLRPHTELGEDRLAIVEALCDPRVIDLQGACGYTALHVAKEVGLEDVYNILLDAGADPSIANEFGELPEDIT